MAEEQGIIIYDPATTNMALERMYQNRNAFPFDTEAKPESEKGITSGAVYAAVSELKGATVLNKGYWPDSNSLMAGVPSAEEGSIAYVGANAPYAIYRYASGGWADTGHTYTPEVDPGEFKVTVDKELDAESENPIANRAVKDTMDKITTEYNVSAFHPDEGTDGTDRYTLETAIVKVPESLRNVGIKCSFLDDAGRLQTWEFTGGEWAASSFSQVGSAAIESQKDEVNAARDEAIASISGKEQEAVSNFNAQRVTPEMLSESTKQFINAAGGGTITNLADDEDIASVNEGEGLSVLKLADRAYNPSNFSGKGYKILRRNIVEGKNVLTQEMVNEPDTVYEIRYDFDLDGGQIIIPENCILKFDGGSLSNGKLTSIGYVSCMNSGSPDYSNELKCGIDNNFTDTFPINPYSKLRQKNDTRLTLNVGYWSKETPVDQPAQFIDYIKSCGCIGITAVIALHNDEEGNIVRDYPENFYDYYKANGINVEAVKFHIDGGDYHGRDNVEFYRNYANEVRDITRGLAGKSDIHAIFILNEWYEPTDEGNQEMCNITRSLMSDIKALGFKVGISGYRGGQVQYAL